MYTSAPGTGTILGKKLRKSGECARYETIIPTGPHVDSKMKRLTLLPTNQIRFIAWASYYALNLDSLAKIVK